MKGSSPDRSLTISVIETVVLNINKRSIVNPTETIILKLDGDRVAAYRESVSLRKIGDVLPLLRRALDICPQLIPIFGRTYLSVSGNDKVYIRQVPSIKFLANFTLIPGLTPPTAVLNFQPSGRSTIAEAKSELEWTPPANVKLWFSYRTHNSTWYLTATYLPKDKDTALPVKLPIANQYPEGNLCMGDNNAVRQIYEGPDPWNKPKNLVEFMDRAEKYLASSEWNGDLWSVGSEDDLRAKQMFRWQMTDNQFVQIPFAGDLAGYSRPVGYAHAGVLAHLHTWEGDKL